MDESWVKSHVAHMSATFPTIEIYINESRHTMDTYEGVISHYYIVQPRAMCECM